MVRLAKLAQICQGLCCRGYGASNPYNKMEVAVAVRFAFDLGTHSIGWAVFKIGDRKSVEKGEKERDVPIALVDLGVRLFSDGREAKSGDSLAKLRREPRGARRRRDRFLQRRKYVLSLFEQYGFLPRDVSERNALFKNDPYRIRAKAAEEKISLAELGRVFLHINQRRGFKSNRKAPLKDGEDLGKIASAARELQDHLDADGYKTLGQFYAARQSAKKPRNRLPVRIRLHGDGAKSFYEFYPLREVVEAEFDCIWDVQKKYHPELTNERYSTLKKAVFWQRKLKPVEPGRCTFFPDEPRLSDAYEAAQEFRIYQVVNNIRIIHAHSERQLGKDERDRLVDRLMKGEKLSWTKTRKILNLDASYQINLELGGEKELKPNQVALLMEGGSSKKPGPFRGRWSKLTERERTEIVDFLLTAEEDEEVVSWAMDELELDEQDAGKLSRLRLPDTFRRLSRKAIDLIVDRLKDDVITYSEATAQCGFHHSDIGIQTQFSRLPYYNRIPELQRFLGRSSGDPEDPPDIRYGRISNPTVHIGLNQLRRVCNALIDRYGAPAQIVVELARELKQSEKQRKAAAKKIAENRSANDTRRERLAELGVISVGQTKIGDALMRLRMWEELGSDPKHCPYTGRPIPLSKLFDSEIEIEHILPFSRTLDNSPANLTVAYRKANRLKTNLSPTEAAERHPDIFDQKVMLNRVRSSTMPKNKQWRFEADAMERYENEEEFVARQLNETQYLSRMARTYLECLFPPRSDNGERKQCVWVVPGRLTFLLRNRFGLKLSSNTPKNRDDHRHHAMDAAVIGVIDRSLIQRISRKSSVDEAVGVDRLLAGLGEPFDGYREQVLSRIETVYVTSRARHVDANPEDVTRTSGKLHEETYYGLVIDRPEHAADLEIGNVVRRKPVVSLTVNEISAVRDLALRESLQKATGIDKESKKSLYSQKEIISILQEWSVENNVRRVRVLKKESALVKIAHRDSQDVYKAVVPADNAYIDIYENDKGRWYGVTVDSFNANSSGYKDDLPIRDRFVMRVYKGDFLQLYESDGVSNCVKRVYQLKPSASQIVLADHREGGELQKRHDSPDDSFRWDFATISKLKIRRARRARFTAAGRMKTIPHGQV